MPFMIELWNRALQAKHLSIYWADLSSFCISQCWLRSGWPWYLHSSFTCLLEWMEQWEMQGPDPLGLDSLDLYVFIFGMSAQIINILCFLPLIPQPRCLPFRGEFIFWFPRKQVCTLLSLELSNYPATLVRIILLVLIPRVAACNHTKSSHEGPTALHSVDGEMCEHHLRPTSEASVSALPVWFAQAPALRDLNHSAGAKNLFYFRCCNG